GKGSGSRAYRKGGPPLERIHTQEWSDESTALAFEMYQIDFWGRKDLGTGCLINLTDGGEGAFSGEANPMWGKTHGPEARVKIGATSKKLWEEAREDLVAAQMAGW